MTDFLDRFGAQLSTAERRLAAAALRPARRRWRTRRGAGLALVGVVIAVPAMATTRPWQPILGEPSQQNTPASVSTSPVPREQLEHLGVLRRPQTDTDRGPAAERLLARIGGEYDGVRLASVRLLGSSDGRHALLVSTERHGGGADQTGDRLCIEHAEGGFCGEAQSVRAGSFVGGFDDNVLGLVPDGVARVVLRFADGTRLTADVEDNFFWIAGAPHAERTVRRVPTPPAAIPPTTTFGLPAPGVNWLDAHGERVEPSR